MKLPELYYVAIHKLVDKPVDNYKEEDKVKGKVCCKNCKFFRPARKKGIGECRRFPPVPYTEHWSKNDEWRFPVVKDRDWCGEFKEKEEEN